jgi:hypothetical protein
MNVETIIINNGVNHKKGLSAIPLHVEAVLSIGTLTALRFDGHGISFSKSYCQLRVCHSGKIQHSTYSFAEWGSPQKAVDAAMNRCLILRSANARKPVLLTPEDGVVYYKHFCKRVNDKRCGYKVGFTKPCKTLSRKTFLIGGEISTADRQLHAFRTAKAFHAESVRGGTDFDATVYNEWRYKRMYTLSHEAFDWDATAILPEVD